ncbi:unnamed protein product [Caenorhabditis auriculariae]|uniref:ZP domain-containing protein n=1 Tax=Caenorhabditis auriculariae TaxID=2777116 RepID=A0A8S1GP32_9PELO|nr:unnamed protein product [Caenorhabditis auriculariae]
MILLFLPLLSAVLGVKPVWRTPVSEPNPPSLNSSRVQHSSLSKRAQPNYYTRPEQFSVPDYRPPDQNIPQRRGPTAPQRSIHPNTNFNPKFYPIPTVHNKGQPPFPQLSQLPPNWQQYPLQMIWVPNPPNSAPNAAPYWYGAPPVPPQGQFGPTSTKQPASEPSANPENYQGTFPHSPAPQNPETTAPTVQTETPKVSSYSEPTEAITEMTEPPFRPETNPYQNPTSALPEDSTTSRLVPPPSVSSVVPPVYLSPEDSSETVSPQETTSPIIERPQNNYIPSETERPTEDTATPKSDTENSENIFSSPPQSTSKKPEEDEEDMLRNFFPRPMTAQAYQPPAHQPEEFTSHIDVHFKTPARNCNSPYCASVDADKVSLYKPDAKHENGPTLVISNVAKEDASRAGYAPPQPPPAVNNPYQPPNVEQDYGQPYSPTQNIFPPFSPSPLPFQPTTRRPEAVPRSLVPAHMLSQPTTLPLATPFSETTTSPTESFSPTARTLRPIAATVAAPSSTKGPTGPTPPPQPEYLPPAIEHMTLSTAAHPDFHPTYKPLHPEATTSTTSAPSPKEDQTPAVVTRKPDFPTLRYQTSDSTLSPPLSSSTEKVLLTTANAPPTALPPQKTSTIEFTTSPTITTLKVPATPGLNTIEVTFARPSPPTLTYPTSPAPEATSPGHTPQQIAPRIPNRNPYDPPEGAPAVPNRVRGKPHIVCQENGITFEAKTILPFTGQIFANDRKRVPECAKSFNEENNPSVFLPFDKCGVRNTGDQEDSLAQVVLVVDQGNGTNTLQSFMAQCVHQKIGYDRQNVPRRIEEALEELRLVPARLEQKASLPTVEMQLLVDQGHHNVSAADIGMPLAVHWRLNPQSDAYGFHVRNCLVVDTIGKLEHKLIDEQGCSTDLSIIDHPHYDSFRDTAAAHMWAFKVPDMSSLRIKCDVFVCAAIKTSDTNVSSCEDVPSPPFCADVVTSPPNSILSDAKRYEKTRRYAEEPSETQTVRAALCLSQNCHHKIAGDVRLCVNAQFVTASTGFSIAFLLFVISLNVIVRAKT